MYEHKKNIFIRELICLYMSLSKRISFICILSDIYVNVCLFAVTSIETWGKHNHFFIDYKKPKTHLVFKCVKDDADS